MGFKEDNPFEKRLNESKRIIEKHRSRVPIIIEKNKNSIITDIDKNKYLVPNDLTMNQFIYIVRKRLKLKSSESIFLLVNNQLCPSNEVFSEIYEKHSDKDGFLYIIYTTENTFG